MQKYILLSSSEVSSFNEPSDHDDIHKDEQKTLSPSSVTFVRETLRLMSTGLKGSSRRQSSSKGPHWGPVLGSNRFSFNSTGVFSFTNRYAVQAGVVASAGGVINTMIAANPTIPTNWSQQSSIFDNYRINAIRLTLVPRQSLTNTDVALAIAFDDDNGAAVAPTSIDFVMQYGDVWFGSTRAPPGSFSNGGRVAPYTYTCAPPSKATMPNTVISAGTIVQPNLGSWCDIGSATGGSNGNFLLRADGCTASQTYFDYIVELEMQFRQTR
jgi:hypothetical protein